MFLLGVEHRKAPHIKIVIELINQVLRLGFFNIIRTHEEICGGNFDKIHPTKGVNGMSTWGLFDGSGTGHNSGSLSNGCNGNGAIRSFDFQRIGTQA